MEPDQKKKIKHLVDILKFILTIDDEEIVQSSIESVIEQLEEIGQELEE